MKIEYEAYDYKGKLNKETCTFEEAVVKELIYNEVSSRFSVSLEKNRLEDQPTEVCKAFGRLLEILARKGIINVDDMHEVLNSRIGFKNTAVFKDD